LNKEPLAYDALVKELAEMKDRFRELETAFQTVKESEERYRNFIDNVQEACYETDLQGNFTFINEALIKGTGYSKDQILGRPSMGTFDPEEAKKLTQVYRELFQTGKPVNLLVYKYLNKEGITRYAENSGTLIRDTEGNPVGFRSISRDVTDRIKKEKELERYREFFENIEDSIFEMDLQGRFTFFNQATCCNTEYSPEELRNFDQRKWYVTQEDADKVNAIYNELYRTGISVKAKEYRVLTKTGKIIYFDISISLIRDEKGHPIGYRCISRDITERKRLEQEQEKLKERLIQSEKLEALGTLAGGIAHDFNNLLMGVQGYTSLMLLDIDSAHPNYVRLKAIEEQVKSGADLTRQLLGYAQGGRYVVTNTDMNELVGNSISMFARFKKEIRVHQKYEPSLWKVKVDRGQMEQVFLNLFINAWQAMPGGGSLYLETNNMVLGEDYVKSHDISPGNYVKITVTDTGAGMDDKTKQRIFEPFFTTKEMGRGAGLGLATVYGIIKGHQGIINVYSERGHGSTFNIYLPAPEQEETKPEVPLPQKTTIPGAVLLVDDDQMIREVTKALLIRLGYPVIPAGNGEEALILYRSHREQIDLLIVDMIMPEMGGSEVIDQIRSINPKARVILSSGYSLNGDAKDILNRGGAQAFIQKPFQIQELAEKIKEVLSL
jgi:two-component system, cell cycle sensor histidine kinase and response regulator CckA